MCTPLVNPKGVPWASDASLVAIPPWGPTTRSPWYASAMYRSPLISLKCNPSGRPQICSRSSWSCGPSHPSLSVIATCHQPKHSSRLTYVWVYIYIFHFLFVSFNKIYIYLYLIIFSSFNFFLIYMENKKDFFFE